MKLRTKIWMSIMALTFAYVLVGVILLIVGITPLGRTLMYIVFFPLLGSMFVGIAIWTGDR